MPDLYTSDVSGRLDWLKVRRIMSAPTIILHSKARNGVFAPPKVNRTKTEQVHQM